MKMGIACEITLKREVDNVSVQLGKMRLQSKLARTVEENRKLMTELRNELEDKDELRKELEQELKEEMRKRDG